MATDILMAVLNLQVKLSSNEMIQQLSMVNHKGYNTAIMVLHAIENKHELLLHVKEDTNCPFSKPTHILPSSITITLLCYISKQRVSREMYI
jgi:hypothetical protein